MGIVQSVHLNLIAGEDLSDLLHLLDGHAEVVGLLEDKLIQFDIGEVFVEVLKELISLFDYLIRQIDQIVAHSKHLISRVRLSVHFCR